MVKYVIHDSTVVEHQQELPVIDKADVLVAGGGIAGLGAAIASAREGVRTILVERLSFLGGVATANEMQCINACSYMEGIIKELVERMGKAGGAAVYNAEERHAASRDGYYDETTAFEIESFKATALEMCVEAGVILYLYTTAAMPIVVDGAVAGLVIESKAGRQVITANRVIDCTGDGDLLYRAGVPWAYGREIDNKPRPFALMFRVGGLDVKKIHNYLAENPDEWDVRYSVDPCHEVGGDMVYTRLSGSEKLVEKAKKEGYLYPEIHYFRMEALFTEKGIGLVNNTRIYNADGTNPKDLTMAEIEGRRQLKKIVEFMKKYVPGCEKAFVIDVAPVMGVRETRRFKGEYFLTDEDVYRDASFEDNIMLVERIMPRKDKMYELDRHPPEPIEGSKKDMLTFDNRNAALEMRRFHFNYRMLLPLGLDNTLFAGRTMSTTHPTEAFVRSMTWCMRLGQVAGTAAALSVKENVSPKKLKYELLKSALLKQGYNRL